jgi:hypothetical protein
MPNLGCHGGVGIYFQSGSLTITIVCALPPNSLKGVPLTHSSDRPL